MAFFLARYHPIRVSKRLDTMSFCSINQKYYRIKDKLTRFLDETVETLYEDLNVETLYYRCFLTNR